MDRRGSVLDVLIPNLQQTPRTVVPYRYLMRKNGGERDQFIHEKFVVRDRCFTRVRPTESVAVAAAAVNGFY